jgi:hypothetical protein
MKDTEEYYVHNVKKIGDKLVIIIVQIVVNHCII